MNYELGTTPRVAQQLERKHTCSLWAADVWDAPRRFMLGNRRRPEQSSRLAA
jgi:hypothetical protein